VVARERGRPSVVERSVVTLAGRRAGSASGPTTQVTDEFVRELHAMLTGVVQRAPLFADLRSRGLADDLVQETLLAVTRRIDRGNAIEDPFTYATRCVTNLAKRTYLRAARESAIGDEALEVLAPAVEDIADRVERRAEMSEVLDMIRSVNAVIADLDPLELELVRAELARTDQKKLATRLGISRPTLYRRKGPAISAFVAAVAARAGTSPCPEHAGALLAAAGASGFDGARAAAAHAASCEQCSETIRHLEVARHGLAIIAPIPLVASGGDPARMVERGQTALDTVVDWARNLVVRVGDPTPMGGSATKTVALVAAACTGGGGIYCAVDGVPSQLKAPFEQHAKHKPRSQPKTVAAQTGSAGRFVPASQVVSQASSAVRAVGQQTTHHEVLAQAKAERIRAARIAAAKRRKAAAAARRRHEQAALEFAARQAAARAASPATGEFAPAPAATSGDPIVRREFTPPAGGGSPSGSATQTKREFGTP
jgi:RNA polymerase sigma factor (sigma-70 family)